MAIKTPCPQCKDSSGKPTGKVNGRKCPLCRGKKFIFA